MPAAIVRLLKRRATQQLPLALRRRQALQEITNVFRIDVVQAWADLPPPPVGVEVDFPLELPPEEVQVLDLGHYLTLGIRAVMENDQEAIQILGDAWSERRLTDAFNQDMRRDFFLYGNPQGVFWQFNEPGDFFENPLTWELMAENVAAWEDDFVETHRENLEYIRDNHQEFSLMVMPYLDDLTTIMEFIGWVNGDRRIPNRIADIWTDPELRP